MFETGELGLIKLIRSLEQSNIKSLIGIGDDAAVIEWHQGNLLVITTDSFVENVHFSPSWAGFREIGYRCLAATLSDLAAMAAEPVGFFVSVGLRPDFEVKNFLDIYSGFFELASRYEVELMGGDIVSSPSLFIALTAFGWGKRKWLRTRSEARPGDVVLVTGNPGRSALGLEALKKGINSTSQNYEMFLPFINAHLKPEPRIKEALLLTRIGAKAMEDISDGLASEAIHLAEESQVGIEIIAEKLPLTEEFKKAAKKIGAKPENLILYGGEDFELVFTVSEDRFSNLFEQAKKAGIKLTEVGRVIEGEKAWLIKGRKKIALRPGYEHFKTA